jgi:hypothetical protein
MANAVVADIAVAIAQIALVSERFVDAGMVVPPSVYMVSQLVWFVKGFSLIRSAIQ